MRQKLGLACTLVRAPRLLLLDEPTVGVDPVSRRELWAIVYRLVEQHGMSVLLSTAYLDEAERCAGVIMLHQGQVLGQGAPHEFSERMRGRSYAVRVIGVKNRVLQERLSGAPDVVDAVVQSDHVRLVMARAEAPAAEKLLADVDDVHIEAVAPRFEDCFVAELRKQSARGPSVSADAGVEAAPVDKRAAGPVIDVRDIHRRFGNFYAVKNVSFKVDRGEELHFPVRVEQNALFLALMAAGFLALARRRARKRLE